MKLKTQDKNMETEDKDEQTEEQVEETPPKASTEPNIDDFLKSRKNREKLEAYVKNMLSSDDVLEKIAGKTSETKQAEDEKDTGNYKLLFEREKVKTDSLSKDSEELKSFKSRINDFVEDLVKDWPEEVIEYDPGDELPSQRLSWVTKSFPLVAKLSKLKTPNMEAGAGNQRNQRNQETSKNKDSGNDKKSEELVDNVLNKYINSSYNLTKR